MREDAAKAKVSGSKHKPPCVNIITRNNVNLLNPETDRNDFINNRLHSADESNKMNLTKLQIRNRQIGSTDLPTFNGGAAKCARNS